MNPDLDAISKHMADEIMRKTESDIINMLAPSVIPPVLFLDPIYIPERDGTAFSRFNAWNHVIVHQPSAPLMVTCCESDGVFLTDRECRAIKNWNRAKARKNRRRTKYWAGVCLKLQRNGH